MDEYKLLQSINKHKSKKSDMNIYYLFESQTTIKLNCKKKNMFKFNLQIIN